MNQGKLDVIKHELTRLNIEILGVSELKWTGMGDFTSDNHHIFYCGQESHRRNGVAIIVNHWVGKAVLSYNPINDRMISIQIEVKPFNITVIQVYAPTMDVEEAEIDQFYEDRRYSTHDRYNTKKRFYYPIGDWNVKVGNQKTPGITGKLDLGVQNEAGQRLVEFCQDNSLVIANTLFQQPPRRLYTWTSPVDNIEINLTIHFAAKDGGALYSQQKQNLELTVWN
ncbi:Hypothetical predicted protein [Pelobates cultripes]|uniref:Uncharacterized protein n=1 Tax=Pelobates cultripes TaxID=61616 RepID=A0AAD1SLD9_PELCU|nr:Hypothetical predicted protein [Pelobates cultripes]CAH2324772.1 Hypothetical predicted protein [Pelobates cultripes]